MNLVDWFSAFGAGWGTDAYLLGVGILYALAAITAFRLAGDESRSFREVTLAAGAALLVAWSAILVHQWSLGRAHWLSRAAFAVATGPVMVGFLLGGSPDRGTSRRLWGLLAFMFLPLVGLLGALLLTRGRVGLGTVVLSATIVFFLVLDAIWAYPLYRLGRSVSVESS